MIIADIDVYRAAKMYVDKYEEDATSEALKKSAELFAAGNVAGGETWQKIARAACWMLNEETYEEESIQ